MTSALRLQRLLSDRGYEPLNDPGFISGDNANGERLSLFTWGSDVHAEQSLIPRKYLVICAAGGRWRLPLAEWERFMPVDEQTTRPWSDVLAEFDEVFLPALRGEGTLPDYGDERYSLDLGLRDRFAQVGLSEVSYRKGVRRVARDGRIYAVTVAGADLSVLNEQGVTTSLTLTRATTWDDVVDWLRDATA